MGVLTRTCFGDFRVGFSYVHRVWCLVSLSIWNDAMLYPFTMHVIIYQQMSIYLFGRLDIIEQQELYLVKI